MLGVGLVFTLIRRLLSSEVDLKAISQIKSPICLKAWLVTSKDLPR